MKCRLVRGNGRPLRRAAGRGLCDGQRLMTLFLRTGGAWKSIQLLRESIRRNFCGAAAMATDTMFAALRDHAEYGELLRAAEACRSRFREHVRARAP